MIQTSTFIILGITAVLTIFTPIVMAVIWSKKTNAKMKSLFVGAGVFILFVVILESILHSLVLSADSIIYQNTFLYVLYGCLAAAFFEEVGRFVAFRYFLKNEDRKQDAVMYGIGHGGVEMILLVGLSLLSSLLFAWTLNSSGAQEMLKDLSDEVMRQSLLDMIASLQGYGIMNALMTLLERASAMILHIACSVLVFKSVREKNRTLFITAFGFHVLANIPATLAQKQVLTQIWLVEFMILAVALAAGYYAWKEYKKM